MYKKALKHKKAFMSQSKIGRPSFSSTWTVQEREEERRLRLNKGLFDSNYTSYVKSQVAASITLNLKELESLLYAAKKHSNDRVLRRLNSISSPYESFANETKYHLRRWVDMERAVQQKCG